MSGEESRAVALRSTRLMESVKRTSNGAASPEKIAKIEKACLGRLADPSGVLSSVVIEDQVVGSSTSGQDLSTQD